MKGLGLGYMTHEDIQEDQSLDSDLKIRNKKSRKSESPGPADYEIDRSFNNIKAYEHFGKN